MFRFVGMFCHAYELCAVYFQYQLCVCLVSVYNTNNHNSQQFDDVCLLVFCMHDKTIREVKQYLYMCLQLVVVFTCISFQRSSKNCLVLLDKGQPSICAYHPFVGHVMN